jgi:hypothetical protein
LITLTAGGASLSNFAPGSTAAGTSTLTATDTDPGGWSLQAQDLGSGSGTMVASAAGCTGSSATLGDPLQLSISGTLSGVNYASAANLTGTNRTVASATNAPMATPTNFTANYSQPIPASQVLRTGCVYTITVTYTLQ